MLARSVETDGTLNDTIGLALNVRVGWVTDTQGNDRDAPR